MSQYRTFTADDALDYARCYGGLSDPEQLVAAREIGDGNLNLVFKIIDKHEISRVVVKQALPYVRCVGESWPLTLDRARLEAQTLLEHYKYAPEHTVKIIHYDPELAVMVMEDLSSLQLLRNELITGRQHHHMSRQLARYLAKVLFFTSDFALAPDVKKQKVIQFTNPEMCAITEQLFFTDPYRQHSRNDYPAALASLVTDLHQDKEVLQAVAALKHRFLSHAEALLHGDIHSGSVFINDQSMKAIDAEFGYFGPMGFDCGTLIGNLLLNYCALPGLLASREAAEAREWRLQEILSFWRYFRRNFVELATQSTQDQALATAGYVAHFIDNVWRDTIGYAGTELIRRTVGLSHVADLSLIDDKEMQLLCLKNALNLGRTLIVAAAHIPDAEQLVARIRQVA